MQPLALIAEVKCVWVQVGEGMQSSGGRCPKCNWHNLDIFTRVDGRGVSYGSWRPEKVLFAGVGWGVESEGKGFGPSSSILGAQVGVRGPGVSAGVVVSVAYY